MKQILKKGQRFDREDLRAKTHSNDSRPMREPYSESNALELLDKHGLEGLSFYRNGPFLDMCEGPARRQRRRRFRATPSSLKNVAGAYCVAIRAT